MSAQFGQGRMGAFPPVIKFLLASNVIVFIIQSIFLQGMTFGGLPIDVVVMEKFALWPATSGSFLPWQLLSYQFMHGGISHLLFNMLALWMFGVELEYIWGSRKFAAYYVLSGIAAGVFHLVITPLLGGGLAPTIGASGSIMGILLAFGMTFPDRPIMMFPLFFPIPARIFVMIYAGFDLINGLFNAGDGVAHFAHLGGALGGFLLIKFGEPLSTGSREPNTATAINVDRTSLMLTSAMCRVGALCQRMITLNLFRNRCERQLRIRLQGLW